MRCEDDGGRYDDYWFWEPLSSWRSFPGQARALLNMIAAVHQGKAGSPEDVHAAHAGHRHTGWVPTTVGATRLEIAVCVDEWLQLARVRPVVRWLDGEAARISLGGGNLFGAVGITLAMQAARLEGLAICSACGIAYTPTRRPRADQRHYCERCRTEGAPQRDAATDYRKRQYSP
jgi:hypothetical protein